MSKLEELIQKLCPDGVECKAFSDVCQYIRGITYNKSQETNSEDDTAVKVLRANNITLATNTLNFNDVKKVSSDVRIKKEQFLCKGDILICAGSGSKEHIGKVAYIFEDEDYSFGGFMAVIRCQKFLESRFLFHVLTSDLFKHYLETALNSSTINNLSFGVIKDFMIPVPPIEVQSEIVRILDNFTELTAELTAELIARKQQYKYYKNEILKFKDVKIFKKLGEIVSFRNGKGHEKDITYDGKYVVVNSKFISSNGEVKKFSDKQLCPLVKDDILIVMSDLPNGKALAKCFLVDKDNKYTLNQRIGALHSLNENEVSTKFLFYVLGRNPQLLKYDNGVDQTNLKKSDILNILIPIPPLTIQKQVVNILDHFDMLCDDLVSGLPAEIQARQKQYEYYRDKLLTFKEKIA